MIQKKRNSETIHQRLLKEIYQNYGKISVKDISEEFNVTTAAIYKQLKKLEQNGTLKATKVGRSKKYTLVDIFSQIKTYPISGLSEDIILKRDMSALLDGVPATARSTFSYVFTEMLNNAIEHSESEAVTIDCLRNAYAIKCSISDQGVGIFSKIQKAMNLDEKRFAILELAKGKFTTDPDSHTGEGIFFSSKVADHFLIFSDSLIFFGDNSGDDTTPILDDDFNKEKEQGTLVYFEIALDRTTTVAEIFNRYTEAPDDYGFSKTIVPVHLLDYREENPIFVSRSQAKRLLVRFERFANIVLDFTDVTEIGQGFADEIFRVFPSQHPDTKITYINAVPLVEYMIKRAQSVR